MVAAPFSGAAPPLRLALYYGREYRLTVLGLGLACCAVEVAAASLRALDAVAEPPSPEAEREPVQVLVVAGTVTDKLAPAVWQAYRDLPQPAHVISFGACSNTGGPYWDSYSVTKGVDQLLPVTCYVPGCPPRPEALLDALRGLPG